MRNFTFNTDKTYKDIIYLKGNNSSFEDNVRTIANLCGAKSAKKATRRSSKPSFSDMSEKKLRDGNGVSLAIFITGIGGLNSIINETHLKEINKILSNTNSTLFIVRDKKDDPEFFTEVRVIDNIILVPDFTLVSVSLRDGNIRNILCIGGEVTYDRSWRMKIGNTRKKKTAKTVFFLNEAPNYNHDEFYGFIKENAKDVDIIVSNSPISLIGNDPYTVTEDCEWCASDETLENDIKNYRQIMDDVYKCLMELHKTPKMWFHTEFSPREGNYIYHTNFINDCSYTFYDSIARQLIYNDSKKHPSKRINHVLENLINSDLEIARPNIARGVGGRLMAGHAIMQDNMDIAVNIAREPRNQINQINHDEVQRAINELNDVMGNGADHFDVESEDVEMTYEEDTPTNPEAEGVIVGTDNAVGANVGVAEDTNREFVRADRGITFDLPQWYNEPIGYRIDGR